MKPAPFVVSFGRVALFGFAGTSLLTVSALAQWSSDPSLNFAVADAPSDQNQAKVVPAGDGGVWISWFDGIASGYDVRLQRLDINGLEHFGHGGLLVADRGFTSTQDYGLDVGPSGALLAFRDDRPGGTQITAARVDALGVPLWGASGVVLTSTTNFVASPKVAATSDGGAVVAWLEGSSVRLQKLNAGGVVQWGPGVTLTPAAGSYSVADLHAVGAEVVLSFVHQTGGFSSPRHLRAQRFDASGATLWGAGSLAVFEGGSLQIGDFPTFSVDAAGGSLFSWYSSSPALQCFVQHIDAAGIERFAHNGLAVSTQAGQIRVNPSAGLNEANGDIYVAWREQSANQAMNGVSVQRINAQGTRLWSDFGLPLVSLGAPTQGLVQVAVGSAPSGLAGGVLVVWSTTPSFGADVLGAAHVTAPGIIDVPRFDVASTPSQKMRLAAIHDAVSITLAWTDGRNDGGDILAQRVGLDGVLANAASVGTSYCGPAVGNSSGAAAVTRAFGSALVADDDLTLYGAGLPPQVFSFFVVSRTSGFVANPGGSQGNLCLGGVIGRSVGGTTPLANVSGGVSTSAPLGAMPVPMGSMQVQAGETWYFQCWYRDTVGGAATSNFSAGLAVSFL